MAMSFGNQGGLFLLPSEHLMLLRTKEVVYFCVQNFPIKVQDRNRQDIVVMLEVDVFY